MVLDLLAQAPDAFVVTAPSGDVLSANRAFLDLVELGDEGQVLGKPIADWLGRPGADVPMLLSMLKKHGALRLVATAARGQLGAVTEVEVSACGLRTPSRRPWRSSSATSVGASRAACRARGTSRAPWSS
jgi:PAS domain-containing protein